MLSPTGDCWTSPSWDNSKDDAGIDVHGRNGHCSDREVNLLLWDLNTGIVTPDIHITGRYYRCGINHKRPMYRKVAEKDIPGTSDAYQERCSYVYYWEEEPGEAGAWWIGPEIGGDKVCAKNSNPEWTIPQGGWVVLANISSEIQLTLVVEHVCRTERHGHATKSVNTDMAAGSSYPETRSRSRSSLVRTLRRRAYEEPGGRY